MTTASDSAREKWWLPAEPEDAEAAAEVDVDQPGAGLVRAAEADYEGSSLPAVIQFDEHEEIAASNGWPYLDLDDPAVPIHPKVAKLIKPVDARRLGVIPVRLDADTIWIAVENPDDFNIAQKLRPLFPDRRVRLLYANPAAIARRIESVYSASAEAENITGVQKVAKLDAEGDAGGDLGRVASGVESENAGLVDLILEEAFRKGASDIHMEPTKFGFEIRLRIDGKLRLSNTFETSRQEEMINILKVRASLRTDNQYKPDSGTLRFAPAGHEGLDLRLETAPTTWGQSAVMRLGTSEMRELAGLGFTEENLAKFAHAVAQPYGVVVCCGPTGSGKTTTLYAGLNGLRSPDRKIITLENPVEIKVDVGLTQMSINTDQGMTFDLGLRSILRQDPDVVLIGEIRDEVTAETAVDAAMTGHLVLSTLHTNTALGVFPRLNRMGIETDMLGEAMLAVVAQRLARRLCNDCKVAKTYSEQELEEMGFSLELAGKQMFEPKPDGCQECAGMGYAGRVPLHEVLVVTDAVAEAVSNNEGMRRVRDAALEGGMKWMRDDGVIKASQGHTSLAEVNANTRQAL